MLPDKALLATNAKEMPAATQSNAAASAVMSNVAATNGRASAKSASSTANPPSAQPPAADFAAPKTDKPRPHLCMTCSKAFHRLEHLKRHERSHTKEKPFECPECARCFARRDLLLRHQQKLHLTATTSSRPRSNRRDSTSSMAGTGPNRVRKNSIAAGGNTSNSMRPRANTISHVDGNTPGQLNAAQLIGLQNGIMGPGHRQHPSLTNLPGANGFQYRGMSTSLGQHGNRSGLPKLETHGLPNMELGGGLRTAPPHGGLAGHDPEYDGMFFGPGSTINPAQLHFSHSPNTLNMTNGNSPFNHVFPPMHNGQMLMEDEENFDWMNGFENQMSFGTTNEQALDGSSPSAISTASQSGISEVMLDGSNQAATTSGVWQQTSLMAPAQQTPNAFSMDMTGSAFMDSMGPPDMISPKVLQGQETLHENFLDTSPQLNNLNTNPLMAGISNPMFHSRMQFKDEDQSTPLGLYSSGRHLSIDTITDSGRQVMMASLSQPSPFNHRKYSAPSIASPVPAGTTKGRASSASLPSTQDLKRYVSAYIHYFHPHLPFLHVPTLAFDSPAYYEPFSAPESADSLPQSGFTGGGGCLILAMAAIGALYEQETEPAKDLFDSSKKMMQLFLDRHKNEVAMSMNGTFPAAEATNQTTPLWLVQAMLLNVIYGHNCGDKTSSDIASTHCVALVGLARSAELKQPLAPHHNWSQSHAFGSGSEDVQMGDDGSMSDSWTQHMTPEISALQTEWHNWKISEERKRTIYAVFILSSLLVSAYNHAPALTNSEILLDLPCSEDLWTAEDAQTWQSRGGSAAVDQQALPFNRALAYLLSASQRQAHRQQISQSFQESFGAGVQIEDLPESEIKPSAFGCLILINALHNYIWETRQRHHSRQWTVQETEAMHSHIEPALKAWQSAWASDPQHSLERPNPFGQGPLSADSIPLLDLAYVRLFVNLGRSKEAFWQRDFDGMAEELARGAENAQYVEQSPGSGSSGSGQADSGKSVYGSNGSPSTADSSPDLNPTKTLVSGSTAPSFRHNALQTNLTVTQRERHLRKAAFYAADSLSMSDRLGVTFADFTSRELPLQAAMCQFDCAQVLAEWVATIQERVGPQLGILGKEEQLSWDLSSMPGLMEEEDYKLLQKISEVVRNAEMKMTYDMNSMPGMPGLPNTSDCGYGSKILRVTAYMLGKSAVWPVTRLMATSLETQAQHMLSRAVKSTTNHG